MNVDFKPAKRQLVISGVEGIQALSQGQGPVFLAALGFISSNDSTYVSSYIQNPGEFAIDVLRVLKKMGIPYEMSQTVKGLVQGRLEFLKCFEQAKSTGIYVSEQDDQPIALPPDFIRRLKPVQYGPVRRLIEVPHSANFSVPGSGKTTMVLAAYSVLKSRGIVSNMIVVCPRSAFTPWEEEFEACFERKPRSFRIAGLPEERSIGLSNGLEFDLILVTYQMFNNEVDMISSLLTRSNFLMVIDESHHLKKGQGGVWFDAIAGVSLLAKRRMVLTGTPAPNSLKDMESQFDILWPGMGLATPPANKDLEDQLSAVRDSIHPFYSRIKKSDLDLPERISEIHRIEMKPVQKRIYEVLTADVLSECTNTADQRDLVRELRGGFNIIRLLEAASNPTLLNEYSQEFRVPPLPYMGVEIDQLIKKYSHYEVPSKFEASIDLASRIVEKGRKVTIWTNFIDNAFTISKLLKQKGIGAVCVTGSGTDDPEVENRDEVIHKFKTQEGTQVLVATIQSIGESISLHTACTDAIYVDRTFNCGQFIQSLDRIHRIGLSKDKTVAYHFLISGNTIDEPIDERLHLKYERMSALLNDDIGILDLDSENIDENLDILDYEAVIKHLKSYCIK